MNKKFINYSGDSISFDEEILKRGKREEIEIEKGTVLTEPHLEENQKLFEKYADFFSVYPDIYLDLIKPSESNFDLFFYQRIVLRAIMRYKEVYITACRAFSKSFITILGIFLQCIFYPGTKRFICAPNKNQSAQIAKEKIFEIYERWPLLRKEIIGGDISETPGNFGEFFANSLWIAGKSLELIKLQRRFKYQAWMF